MKPATTRRATKQSGFSMIETLIAFAILSFGLMALAGLQVVALRYTQGSVFRTLATMQAASMAETMRANRVAMNAGHFNTPSASAASACFTSSGCSPLQMAQTQYWSWQDMNSKMLPNGRGVVCVDSTPSDGSPADPACDNVAGAPYVIKIFWTDDKIGNVARFSTAVIP